MTAPVVTSDTLPDAPLTWPDELLQAESVCRTYYHMRNTHWIAFGARIWASELLWSPAPDRSLPVELVHSATREIRLRTEFTTWVLGSLAAREHEVPPPIVLVDCARLGSELIRCGSRDVENDIVRTARFLPGVDTKAIHDALAQAIRRLNDHLVDVRHLSARGHLT